MVSENKKKLVQDLIALMKANPIIGVVNLENLPAQQLQNMRAMLRSKDVILTMARKKLLNLALKESGLKNIEKLQEKVRGMPALLFTKNNPFALASLIQKNKSEAPAKAGQVAPDDINVSAGMTNFIPGPIISELAAVGIKTKVTEGKLEIIAEIGVNHEGSLQTLLLCTFHELKTNEISLCLLVFSLAT